MNGFFYIVGHLAFCIARKRKKKNLDIAFNFKCQTAALLTKTTGNFPCALPIWKYLQDFLGWIHLRKTLGVITFYSKIKGGFLDQGKRELDSTEEI